MKQYYIFHAVLPSFDEEVEQERKYVGSVCAESLEQAYQKSQNLDRHWNKYAPCRSTSVGDVIQEDDVDYLVAGIGFKAIIQTK